LPYIKLRYYNKALMAKVEHLNVVQESNSTLRAELEAARSSLAEAKQAIATAAPLAEAAQREAGAYTRSTSRLNVSGLCGIGGALGGCSWGV
jgi:hypothetical protein